MVHHVTKMVRDPRTEHHAQDQPGKQDKEFRPGHEAHGLLSEQLKKRSHAQVIDHNKHNGEPTQEVHP